MPTYQYHCRKCGADFEHAEQQHLDLILDAAADAGVQKVVHTSSSAVFGVPGLGMP